MIPLQRVRTAAVIPAPFHGAKRIKNERDLMEDRRRFLKQEINKQEFDSSRWKPAKERLLDETHGKCAYCEAPTAVVSFGDVEHYRPKSVYWWLAYNYENYLASCAICNQKFKGDQFPIKNASARLKGPKITVRTTDAKILSLAGTAGPDSLNYVSVTGFSAQHVSERPLLLNPYFDDPEQFFAWKADDNLRTVELATPANQPKFKPFIDAAIAHYGLNRVELCDLRYQQFAQFRTLKRVQGVGTLPAAIRNEVDVRIQEMLDDASAFAGMLRFFNNQPNFP